jgi:tetraacyldisaccharide 4'-kinase
VHDEVWYGQGPAARAARGLLAPGGWLFAGVAAARNALYDRGLLATHPSALPVLSLGNLTVGGTGKTPVAAWAAERLRASGARPTIVLRGYGGDEVLVHGRLNPDVPVVADADRVRGVATARALGADCAILDDAFQHRRAARTADWVLVAAERWRDGLRPLPAGPMREPVGSLGRAHLLVVTRKTATLEAAEEIARRLGELVPSGAWAVCHLAPEALVDARSGGTRPLAWLAGRPLVAVAAVGMPDAFFDQLASHGARLDRVAFRDHHSFGASDVAALLRRVEGRQGVVCTLKDAVKLAPLWPAAAPPLWYVSQRAVVERGASALDASLGVILAAREGVSPTAGPAGPSSPAHGHRPSIADR